MPYSSHCIVQHSLKNIKSERHLLCSDMVTNNGELFGMWLKKKWRKLWQKVKKRNRKKAFTSVWMADDDDAWYFNNINVLQHDYLLASYFKCHATFFLCDAVDIVLNLWLPS